MECQCLNDDQWYEKYNTTEPDTMECTFLWDEPVWFELESEQNARIFVHINTTEFAKGLLMYDLEGDEISAPMRWVFRDIDKKVVDSLTQQFNLVVKDAVQETNPCADAELVSASTKARTVYEVVFNSEMLDSGVTEVVPIEIMNSLKTKFVDEAHANCPINY
jgi:hypothetical protein